MSEQPQRRGTTGAGLPDEPEAVGPAGSSDTAAAGRRAPAASGDLGTSHGPGGARGDLGPRGTGEGPGED